MDYLLGERLEPSLRRRIRYEVKRRCIVPYLSRHDFWWLYNTESRTVNNWNAVCNGGVAGAAVYLEEDASRLAEVLTKALRSLEDYIETFDEDGGSSEGPGYWAYGFGYYAVLADLVETRTQGRVNLLEGEFVREVAKFPLKVVLSPGVFVNFSDCDRNFSPPAPLLAYLSCRLEVPELAALSGPTYYKGGLTWRLRSLFWRSDGPPSPFVPSHHDFFRGLQWMLARYDPSDPDALVLAAKGGHNAEMHNQNDVGSFIVHFMGESLIVDPGRGRYTRDYFGPKRYEHLVNSSKGHSVPVPNGCEQRTGREAAAELLEHGANSLTDWMVLELKAAYPPEADLASLRRTLALHREGPTGWVEVTDEARFSSGPGTLESPLITFGSAEVRKDTVIIRGKKGNLKVSWEGASDVRIEKIKDVDLAEGPTDLERIAFRRGPSLEGRIRLKIEPTST
ncbi:MAG TPA: heparinase [Candidatus Latescibacteria bacterium]|nr:heparinase [Candidatus Latescibacterota bacterium]